MNKMLPLFFVLLLCIARFDVFSQDEPSNFTNDANHPCITPHEYALIQKECEFNVKKLGLDKQVKSANAVKLEWPLRVANGLNDYSYYNISAYVDLNAATGAIQDNNCGTNTYDGHRGTDISIWPYNFYKMDNNMVEVIAAAPGTIIAVHDGEFDKNCAGNSLTANYIMIQHADGTSALYWHMKKNSVTTKAVGQTVVAGEYLGVVGSSGSSSGPHLHFEVRTGTFDATTNVDPFTGTCNTKVATSWWTNQKTYKETAIVKASVHTTDVVVPTCPGTEILNVGTVFTVPFQGDGLAAGYAKFYIFIRDEVSGLNADLSILNPNGTVFSSWVYNSTSNTKTKMWGFSKLLPTIPGVYTFKAIYNGITTSSTFEIKTATGVDELLSAGIRIYPNPTKRDLFIEQDVVDGKNVEIFNSVGEVIYSKEMTDLKTAVDLNVATGIYYYKLSKKGVVLTAGKFVVE